MSLRVGKKNPLRRSVTPQRVAAVERRKASVKRTMTITLVLTTLIGAGGAGYTWYMGEQKTAAIATPTPAPSRRVEIKPVKQDPNANVGVSIQVLSSPVQPGQNAAVSVRTNQLANCTITVKYGETLAVDSGLVKKSADNYGTVSWSWTVPASAPVGKAPVKIECANKTKTGVVTADLIVQK